MEAKIIEKAPACQNELFDTPVWLFNTVIFTKTHWQLSNVICSLFGFPEN